MRWAIVIGIDEYGGERPAAPGRRHGRRSGSASGSSSEDGGNVPPRRICAAARRRPEDGARARTTTPPDEGQHRRGDQRRRDRERRRGEQLYFYFSGHGITADVANREESALVTPGLRRAAHRPVARRALAHRALRDDAVPGSVLLHRRVPQSARENREFEIGAWPIPRRRDPGQPPVQQFILYATSPGLTAAEVGWPGEAAARSRTC